MLTQFYNTKFEFELTSLFILDYQQVRLNWLNHKMSSHIGELNSIEFLKTPHVFFLHL